MYVHSDTRGMSVQLIGLYYRILTSVLYTLFVRRQVYSPDTIIASGDAVIESYELAGRADRVNRRFTNRRSARGEPQDCQPPARAILR
jgi:hypothetical protein